MSAWISVVCLLVIVDLISLGLVLLGRFRVFSFGFGVVWWIVGLIPCGCFVYVVCF